MQGLCLEFSLGWKKRYSSIRSSGSTWIKMLSQLTWGKHCPLGHCNIVGQSKLMKNLRMLGKLLTNTCMVTLKRQSAEYLLGQDPFESCQSPQANAS